MADATISSIQSGSRTIVNADGTTINITISSVTTSRSIVMYTTRNADSTVRIRRYVFGASLTSSTNLRFVRQTTDGAAADCVVEWTVIEFDTGVLASLQTGIASRNAATFDVTLGTPVNAAKTFVITHPFTDQLDAVAAVRCYAQIATVSVAGDTLRLVSFGTPGANDSEIYYQVVEFVDGVNVQQGTITVTATNASADATISSVDTTKTFIINAGTSSNDAGTGRSFARLDLINATTVRATRSTVSTEPDMTVGFFVVGLTGTGQSVQKFTSSITNGNSAPASQPTWTALGTKTAIMAGWTMGNAEGDSTTSTPNPTDTMASIALAAGRDGATVARTGTVNALSVTGWAVDWTVAAGQPLVRRMGGIPFASRMKGVW